MVRRFYCEAAVWADADREIAKFVLQDIADYVRTTHATHGLPRCTAMLWPDVIENREGRVRVNSNWKDNPEVQQYLASKKHQGVD
jgi:hypothetical protein